MSYGYIEERQMSNFLNVSEIIRYIQELDPRTNPIPGGGVDIRKKRLRDVQILLRLLTKDNDNPFRVMALDVYDLLERT